MQPCKNIELYKCMYKCVNFEMYKYSNVEKLKSRNVEEYKN